MFGVGWTADHPPSRPIQYLPALTRQRFCTFFTPLFPYVGVEKLDLVPPRLACQFCFHGTRNRCTTPSQPAALLRVLQKVKGHVTPQCRPQRTF